MIQEPAQVTLAVFLVLFRLQDVGVPYPIDIEWRNQTVPWVTLPLQEKELVTPQSVLDGLFVHGRSVPEQVATVGEHKPEYVVVEFNQLPLGELDRCWVEELLRGRSQGWQGYMSLGERLSSSQHGEPRRLNNGQPQAGYILSILKTWFCQ